MDKAEARRTVRVAVKGEMGRRGWNIQQLMDATGLDRSTLGDFLEGKRWPQSRTLGAVEKALEWPVSSIALMLEGGDPPVVSGDTEDADHEEDTLLFRRPDGLSGQEWERVKREARGFIEWQLDRAAQER
jgi:transcriptional regulator with XRE-family HTH domain